MPNNGRRTELTVSHHLKNKQKKTTDVPSGLSLTPPQEQTNKTDVPSGLSLTPPQEQINKTDVPSGLSLTPPQEQNKQNIYRGLWFTKHTPWPLVRERTIPNERQVLVGEVIAN
jgi:hypothetical protein